MWLTPDLRDHLVYWRNPLESGVVFGSVLTFLVAIQYVSLISGLVTNTIFAIFKLRTCHYWVAKGDKGRPRPANIWNNTKKCVFYKCTITIKVCVNCS